MLGRPFVDLNDLHDLGKGCSADVKNVQHGLRIRHADGDHDLPLMCRRIQLFVWWTHGNGNFQWPAEGAVARSDYAANGGDKVVEPGVMALWSSSNCYNADCGPASIPADATLGEVKTEADSWGRRASIIP